MVIEIIEFVVLTLTSSYLYTSPLEFVEHSFDIELDHCATRK